MFDPPVLFALAVCAACAPSPNVGGVRFRPWLAVYLLATAAAVAAGAVTTVGLVALAALLGLAWQAHRAAGMARSALILLFAALAIALSMHSVPGVGKLALHPAPRHASGASAPTINIDVGKAGVDLLLFALLVPRLSCVADARRLWKPTLAIGVVGTALTAGTAMAMGYIRFEPKLPPGTIGFLVSNLLFACIAEESVFRGLLQEQMHRLAERLQRPGLHAAAVMLSAGLFGAAHARWGLHYVVLATLGGATNALAYAKARRVEASAVTHFTLNAAHFIFFSDRMLAR